MSIPKQWDCISRRPWPIALAGTDHLKGLKHYLKHSSYALAAGLANLDNYTRYMCSNRVCIVTDSQLLVSTTSTIGYSYIPRI